MKKALFVIVGGALLGAVPAVADDITIYDTQSNGSSSGWYRKATTGDQKAENQEVEPNCVTGQEWDMEAFLFDAVGKKLQIQGGFNMSGGYGGYYGGDLFIDVNGDAKWGVNTPPDGSGDGWDTRGNSSFLWDYVVVFNRANGGTGGSAYKVESGVTSYSVYNIQGSVTDLEVWYSQNNGSNPFRYLSGGTLVPGAGGTVAQTSFGNTEGTHYLLGDINLSFLANLGTAPDGMLTFHWTEGCGNDNLMGETPAWNVPDGGMTLALLGIGLSAVGFVSSRGRRND
jgi:hypothetical protein